MIKRLCKTQYLFVKIALLLIICIAKIFANNNQHSQSLLQESLDSQYSNIHNIDNDTSDLNTLKRKLELVKTNAEINKIINQKIPTVVTQQSRISQAVVTGVAINKNGTKIAWLRFKDGCNLSVNIGSHVDQYIVTTIDMSQVKLIKPFNRFSLHHPIILNRSYDNEFSNHKTHTPILNQSVFNNSTEEIPPIMNNQ
jgi:hypothetical protein